MEDKNNQNGIPLGSLYMINKQLMKQLPLIEDYSKSKQEIRKLYRNTNNHFYMLYGKQISYFTLFNIKEDSPFAFADEVFSILTDTWEGIYSVSYDKEHNAVEIWVKTPDGAECLYLFPYDSGIVEVA